jgi:hypothetical protein
MMLFALLVGSLARAPWAGPSSDKELKLAVVLVVDQMRGDQLARGRELWRGGLRRFCEHGRVFPAAALTWSGTQTAPGHASLGSAREPRHHGVIANEWTEAGREGSVYCCDDPSAVVLGPAGRLEKEAGRSARLLRGSGAAQLWKHCVPQAKVIAIGGKDRSAILSVGAGADLAAWWDRERGGFVSSTAFVPRLPQWMAEFGQTWPVALRRSPFAQGWQALPPGGVLPADLSPDDQPGELGLGGRRTFPYDLPATWPGEGQSLDERSRARLAGWAFVTPACDWLVLELARSALDRAELGADEHCDLLVLAFSACDSVGHSFGPSSREVLDVLLRLDQELGLWFDTLDRRLGEGRWLAALAADHGVMELPERDQTLSRWDSESAKVFSKELRSSLTAEFGADLIAAQDVFGLRLDRQRCREKGLDLERVRVRAAELARQRLPRYLESAWTWDELRERSRSSPSSDLALADFLVRSFDEERTPDLVFVAARGVLAKSIGGTTHGSPHEYDRSVALAFLGPAFQAGWDSRPASTLDVVPTLFAAVGLGRLEGVEGRSLLSP